MFIGQEYEQILINIIVFFLDYNQSVLFFKYTFNSLKLIYAFTTENINYNSKFNMIIQFIFAAIYS